MAVTASITVKFGAEAADDALLLAEVDDRPAAEGGLNAGKSSFIPGDTAYYLVYKHKITSTTHTASAGSAAYNSSGTRQITETVSFLKEQDASVRYPITSLDSFEWLGNDLGAITSTGGSNIRCAEQGVGVALVTYTTSFDAWGLSSPAEINGRSSFEIAVLIEGA